MCIFSNKHTKTPNIENMNEKNSETNEGIEYECRVKFVKLLN